MGRRAIVLLVALILAGLAGWAVWNFLQNAENEIREGQEIVTVYRAGGAIQEGADGSVLFSDFNSGGALIVESTEQKEDLPVDAIQTQDQLNQVLTGRVAAGPISGNAILTSSQWTELTVDITPLAEKIPSGKQAITISVDNVRGVSGFVEPGDRINMIITTTVPCEFLPEGCEGFATVPIEDPAATPAGEEAVVPSLNISRFVMQGLPVMATGREVRPDEDAPETVEVAPTGQGEGQQGAPDTGNSTIFTLEVTPEQAERIAFAFQNGSIWLTLVPEDFVEIQTFGVTIENLFGGSLAGDIFGN